MRWRRRETLTAAEAEHLALQLAELGKTGLPLESGLRAAASEVPSPRMSRSLGSLADSLEQGQDLDSALLQRRGELPKFFNGYFDAAARTGKFGEVLSQLVEQHRAQRELRASLWSAVAYPLLVLLLVILLVMAAGLFLVDDFDDLYREWQLVLPLPTQILVWFGGIGKWLLLGAVVIAWLGPMLLRSLFGAAAWCRWTSTLPVFGPLRHWSGVAELCRVLAVLLDHGTRLPEALRVAATAVEDAGVGKSAGELAERVERGELLSTSIADSRWLPPSLAPMIAWGEQAESLIEAFHGAAGLFEGRVQLRAAMLRSTLPAVAYLVVASFVGILFAALMTPLLMLISNLSSWDPQGEPAPPTLAPPWLVALVPLGLVLLLVASFIGRRGVIGRTSRVRPLMMTIGWVFLFVGLAVSVGGLAVSVGAVLVVGVVTAATLVRFRRSERRSLLLAIAIATERGIPLPPVIESFVRERTVGARAIELSTSLRSGVPPGDALRQSRHLLSQEAALAADLGTELGDISQALRGVVRQMDEREEVTRWVLDKLFYLTMIPIVAAFIVTFLLIKIIPTMDQMFQEFALELPAITQMVIEVSRIFAKYWYALAPIAVPLVTAGGILAVLGYVGLFPRDLPLVRRFLLREEGARVMRALALAVQHARPLANTIAWLADHYPASGVSARLRQTARAVDQGRSVWDALQSAGLIRTADATVLKSAEQVGNLAWALEEMAASSNRRIALRIRAFVHVFFPSILFFFGMCVLFLAVAFFLPLVDMISSLGS